MGYCNLFIIYSALHMEYRYISKKINIKNHEFALAERVVDHRPMFSCLLSETNPITNMQNYSSRTSRLLLHLVWVDLVVWNL